MLAYAGFRIARRSADRFVQLACVAITVWLVGQAAMNMGYVVGLLPVTGVTLPLISAGGTSLLLTLFIVGLLARFARSEPAAIERSVAATAAGSPGCCCRCPRRGRAGPAAAPPEDRAPGPRRRRRWAHRRPRSGPRREPPRRAPPGAAPTSARGRAAPRGRRAPRPRAGPPSAAAGPQPRADRQARRR